MNRNTGSNNEFSNRGPGYSTNNIEDDRDAEPIIGTVVKDADSTIFSLRDNIRKNGQGSEGYINKQAYLKNKNEANFDRHNQYPQNRNQRNHASPFHLAEMNAESSRDPGTFPEEDKHEKNAYDFT